MEVDFWQAKDSCLHGRLQKGVPNGLEKQNLKKRRREG
uniref:Uncharacterized protein n=1 Tax=Arundo donax TaxID=35708 RepID=A0A0A9FLB4_ARUDO